MKTFCVLIFSWLASFVAVADDSVPHSLTEAFAALDRHLTSEDRQTFKTMPENQATTQAHMSIGMLIRNEWFRAGKSKLVGVLRDAGAQSMDDMSDMVLTSYWRHLNKKPINLKEQGACYAKWWAEQRRLQDKAKSKGESSYGIPAFDCP
jgi:hypothetical protein